MKISQLKVRITELHIDRAQYDLLCKLGIIDPTKKKTGLTIAIRQGLDYVIDKRWEIVKHAARKQ